MPAIRNLILVLGDQLSPAITSLAAGDPARDLVLMAELADEARSVRHHKKKIAFLFSAMRHFAAELRGLGWRVEYVTLDAAGNRGSFTAQLGEAIARHGPERVVVTEAGSGGCGRYRPRGRSGSRCRWTSCRTNASCARPRGSRSGRRAAGSCGWNTSIARCAGAPGC